MTYCQFLYKSGTKKGKLCYKKLNDPKTIYCITHQTVIKSQETKKQNQLKKREDEKTTNQLPTEKGSKPGGRLKPPASPSIGVSVVNSLGLQKEGNNLKKNNKDLTNQIKRCKSTIDIGTNDLIISSVDLLLKREQAKGALPPTEKEQKESIKVIIKPPIEIKFDINLTNLENVNGLLKIINFYKERHNLKSTINYDLEKLCKIKNDLIKLNNMIGIHKIKKNICDMIIYLCQKHIDGNLSLHNEYLHSVIQGPSGCGKSTLAYILANIYTKLGFLSNGNVIVAKRSDLIGKYCGHTAKLTQSIIDEASGGVLFIDEAYSLGNKNDDPDAFSRECIDTLNQNLSEKYDFICIIAGYREELERRFFAINPGLSRRFPWVFTIEKYNSEEMYKIFKLKIKEIGFEIEEETINKNFFNKNKELFPHFGGSIHTFVNKIKICNYKRLFGILDKKSIISLKDVENGFSMYKNSEMGTQFANKNKPPLNMYI